MSSPRVRPEFAPSCLHDCSPPRPLPYGGRTQSQLAPEFALDLENAGADRADPDHARTMRDQAKAAAAAATKPAAKETTDA